MPRLPFNGLKIRIMAAFGIGLIPVFAVTTDLAAVVANPVAIGAIVLACLLSLLTVWLALDRALFQDVRRLLQTLKRIRAGDLHAHIVLEPGEDELRQIAAAMDALAAGLEQRGTEQNETGQVLRLLSQMSQLLLVSQNIEEAAGITCKFAQQLFPTAAGALYIRQPTTDIFNAIAVWGEIPSQDKALAVDDCWALRQSKTYILDSRHPGLKCRHVSDQLVSYLCIPILAQGEIIGLMHLRSPMPMTGIQKT
ncbi:MAG TPA: GAF domain-containing protein, partial [Methylophilaceae bacterium]|nr:GAF domain-containing protein [Methylophilaceae bacterium]